MTVTAELMRTWCQGDRHPPYVTVPRGGKADSEDETDLNMSQPVPCLVLNGAALCLVCLQLYSRELAEFFVGYMEDVWQRIDTRLALESAASLTEKPA